MRYSFCPKCGQPLNIRRLDGIERLVCSSCGFIFYQNSKPCSSVLALEGGKLLLVKRAIEPFKDYWDIPGGFLEAGEHPEAGALREMAEETGLQVRLIDNLGVFMDTYGHSGDPTLNFCYVAEVIGGQARPASDASRLDWFDLQALPAKIAFGWAQQALALLRQKYG
jgi:ADP-ribose pyrophosphatase YjhB (NUDIX family)